MFSEYYINAIGKKYAYLFNIVDSILTMLVNNVLNYCLKIIVIISVAVSTIIVVFRVTRSDDEIYTYIYTYVLVTLRIQFTYI